MRSFSRLIVLLFLLGDLIMPVAIYTCVVVLRRCYAAHDPDAIFAVWISLAVAFACSLWIVRVQSKFDWRAIWRSLRGG